MKGLSQLGSLHSLRNTPICKLNQQQGILEYQNIGPLDIELQQNCLNCIKLDLYFWLIPYSFSRFPCKLHFLHFHPVTYSFSRFPFTKHFPQVHPVPYSFSRFLCTIHFLQVHPVPYSFSRFPCTKLYLDSPCTIHILQVPLYYTFFRFTMCHTHAPGSLVN